MFIVLKVIYEEPNVALFFFPTFKSSYINGLFSYMSGDAQVDAVGRKASLHMGKPSMGICGDRSGL